MEVTPNKSSKKKTKTVFHFPEELKVGDRFSTLAEVFTLLNEESTARGLAILTSKTYTPRVTEWKWLHIRCRKCTGSINIANRDDCVVITLMNKVHDHSSTGVAKVPRKQATNNQRPTTKQKPKKAKKHANKPAEDELNLLTPKLQSKKRIGKAEESRYEPEDEEKDAAAQEEETDDPKPQTPFDALKEYFQNNGINARIGWGNEPHTLFPRVMVISTKCMALNYIKYGDSLCFTVLEGIIQDITHDAQPYQMGVFSVLDNNARILLAGVALFADDSSSNIRQAFKVLFPGKPPNTVLTSYTPIIRKSFDKLRAEGWFEGQHLFTPSEAVRDVTSKLSGSNTYKTKIISLLQTAINTRTEEDYSDCVQELKKFDEQNIIGELLAEKPTIFYHQTAKAFVGISRTGCERTIDLIRKSFPDRITIPKFVVRLFEIDHRLTEESSYLNERYSADLPIFLDNRFKELIEVCERVVVERFIENYLCGLMKFALVNEAQESNGKQYEIRNKVTGTIYTVHNWACECLEYEKTGVACPHQILAATAEGKKPYTDLVAKRWKKNDTSHDEQ